MSRLVLTTEGDREIIVKRRFSAPPEDVYRAHMEPSLLAPSNGPSEHRRAFTRQGVQVVLIIRASLGED